VTEEAPTHAAAVTRREEAQVLAAAAAPSRAPEAPLGRRPAPLAERGRSLAREERSPERGPRRDATSSLGDAKSSLGDAKSSLGDAKSSLGDAKSSLGDAESSLGDATSSAPAARTSSGERATRVAQSPAQASSSSSSRLQQQASSSSSSSSSPRQDPLVRRRSVAAHDPAPQLSPALAADDAFAAAALQQLQRLGAEKSQLVIDRDQLERHAGDLQERLEWMEQDQGSTRDAFRSELSGMHERLRCKQVEIAALESELEETAAVCPPPLPAHSPSSVTLRQLLRRLSEPQCGCSPPTLLERALEAIGGTDCGVRKAAGGEHGR
jgi:hypothetical protein